MHQILVVAWLLVSLIVPAALPAQARSRFFPETQHAVEGRFLEFWEAHGGLATFGYPRSAVVRERNPDDGRDYAVQHFERARFELHPDQAAPNDVQLGRLGAEQLLARGVRWQTLPTPAVTGPDCRFFPETGHQVCGRLLERWRADGIAIYGLPLSELIADTGADGGPTVVQYFERARFELHPANRQPYDVLLGLVEAERLEQRVPPGALVPQPAYFFPVQPAGNARYGAAHHDYPAADIFTPIGSRFVAPTDGVVEFVSRVDRWDPATNRGAERGGLAVSIVGDDGIRYYGSHLSSIADGIVEGSRVAAGQLLGLTGKSGDARTTAPHLHFGISRPTTPDDWAVRRGEISPYPALRQWQTGIPLPPAVPWLMAEH